MYCLVRLVTSVGLGQGDVFCEILNKIGRIIKIIDFLVGLVVFVWLGCDV